MGRLRFKYSRQLFLFLALAVLLPLLAGLQYYWLGQVSEGATERLQSSLRTGAVAFRHDFNRELIRAYLNFHLDSDGAVQDVERFHVERFEKWKQTSPYPQLISDVFVVSRAEEIRLQRVVLQTRRLETVEWSGEQASWRERFEPSANVDPTRQTFLESFAEDIPALIIPLPAEVESPGFTIVKLNRDYIQRELIPALAQRHFLDASPDYDVAVTSLKDPSNVIYSTRQPPAVNTADVSTEIFGLEADELESFLKSDRTPAPASADQQGALPSRLVKLRILKRATRTGASTADNLDGRWLLSIKHKSGSLAAAVTSVRRRNLAISFGVLLLLGAAILMTAISIRRAERLAQQQINFVAGVSHELRTPLAVICSAGQNLSAGIVDDPDKVAKYGDVIYREGRRLTDMVERVLEFAGAGSGKEIYNFRSVDVSELVDSAIAACDSEIVERNFTIETRIDANVPPVHGDSAALRRALQNLISNAIKYDGTEQRARITARTKQNKLEISIADRGRGIPPSEIPHIFEPFYRGREAIAEQIEGSGIGLSLVKQIIDAHHGSIIVNSAPGAGSEFVLSLPIANGLHMSDKL